jgi:hypothetical protein
MQNLVNEVHIHDSETVSHFLPLHTTIILIHSEKKWTFELGFLDKMAKKSHILSSSNTFSL